MVQLVYPTGRAFEELKEKLCGMEGSSFPRNSARFTPSACCGDATRLLVPQQEDLKPSVECPMSIAWSSDPPLVIGIPTQRNRPSRQGHTIFRTIDTKVSREG